MSTSAERDKLAAVYVRLIGYDPFLDDPSTTVEEVRQLLVEYADAVRGPIEQPKQ